MNSFIDLNQIQQIQSINFHDFKAVIFDVDGTFYSLKKMYSLMQIEIFKYYLNNLWEIWDIKIIIDFLRERERNAFEIVEDLENAQYEWAAKASGASLEKVRTLVQKWIFQVPLQHIYTCRYIPILELFENLMYQGIATGIFSDYPATAKLAKLGLSPNCIVSSTDKNVCRLKPDPQGLFIATEILGVSVKQCLFIGDRDEKDGECARRAGMPYLILGKSSQP